MTNVYLHWPLLNLSLTKFSFEVPTFGEMYNDIFFMFQGEMLHYALFQGMHRVFVPIRREGTNRSNDRLRRQTLKQNTRQNSAILNTHPSSIRHRFKNTNVPRNGHHDSAALPSRDKCRVPPF